MFPYYTSIDFYRISVLLIILSTSVPLSAMSYVIYCFSLVSLFLLANTPIFFIYYFFRWYYYLPVLAAAPDNPPHIYRTFSHACFLRKLSFFLYPHYCNILYYKYILKNTYIYLYTILKP